MKRRFLALLLLGSLILFLFSGCATIFAGKKNRIVINDGTPPGAEIYLDGQKLGITPYDKKLDKHLIQDGSQIELRKEGFSTDTITIERKMHGWYFLADILTFGVAFAVDLGTGNIYRPARNKFTYELEKKN
jgi:hypothetical protein